MTLAQGAFDLAGTVEEQRAAEEFLNRGNFPWYALVPGLRGKTGRATIPVTWDDLSRFGASAAAEGAEDGDHEHDDGDDHAHEDDDEHLHIDGAHAITRNIEGRRRVLGLAYYSGRVALERTLISNPDLAAEVFFSEGAHMIDFFLMTDTQRVGIWNAIHVNDKKAQITPDTIFEDGTNLGHGHGWFDVGGYYSWVGEAFMGLIVKAYSNVPLTIQFDHPITADVVRAGRRVLTPYFGNFGSLYFHDSHKGIKQEIWYPSRDVAASEKLPCKVCKP